jgi:hypothetical protein
MYLLHILCFGDLGGKFEIQPFGQMVPERRDIPLPEPDRASFSQVCGSTCREARASFSRVCASTCREARARGSNFLVAGADCTF